MVLAEVRNVDDLLRRQQDTGENATERLSAVLSPSRNLPRRWNVLRFGFGLDNLEHQQQIQRRFQQLPEQQE